MEFVDSLNKEMVDTNQELNSLQEYPETCIQDPKTIEPIMMTMLHYWKRQYMSEQ